MNAEAAGGARVVMVVDDDSVFSQVVASVLKTRNVRAVVLNKSFGLLNAVAQHRPALLFLDVMMPGLDGTSVTGLIRQDAELKSTPVVLCSGLDAASLAQRATSCHADGYISKSAGLAQVRTEVLRWVDRVLPA